MRTYIVDTYAWISYFEGKEEFKSEIEGNDLHTPSVVIAELSRVLKRKKVSRERYSRVVDYVKKHSLILSLDSEQAIKAGEIAEKEDLYLIDAIIYSYVDENRHLLTGDEHFRGKPLTKLIK